MLSSYDKVLIHFNDYQNDGMSKVIEATKAEWDALIAPAVANNHPIDSATVDPDMFDQLYDRKHIKTDIDLIKHVVPLV